MSDEPGKCANGANLDRYRRKPSGHFERPRNVPLQGKSSAYFSKFTQIITTIPPKFVILKSKVGAPLD